MKTFKKRARSKSRPTISPLNRTRKPSPSKKARLSSPYKKDRDQPSKAPAPPSPTPPQQTIPHKPYQKSNVGETYDE